MTQPDPAHPKGFDHNLARHGAGFIASGLIALCVDAGTTSLLTRGVGLSAFIARPVGIGVAMVVAWACHRRLTFDVQAAPSLSEFASYAAVAWSAAAVNYVIYAAILLALPALAPELALVASSLVSMVVSYLGMRFGVFGK